MRTIKRDIVGVFFFSSDGYFLLGKNRKGGVYKDTWVVPGGGIEEGETKTEALKRETMEEVGIDISDYEIIPFEDTARGQSEKTLRDTGETVLVDMEFYDFIVRADKPASELPLNLMDDIAKAAWHKTETLSDLEISKPTRARLVQLGIV